MKFKEIEPSPQLGWSNCRVSEGDPNTISQVHIGVYPVLYGHRVRAGFVRDLWGCVLDWCGGANWDDVERLYNICHGILSARDEGPDCFHGMPPSSNVKPFYNDPVFLTTVGELLPADFEPTIKLRVELPRGLWVP